MFDRFNERKWKFKTRFKIITNGKCSIKTKIVKVDINSESIIKESRKNKKAL